MKMPPVLTLASLAALVLAGSAAADDSDNFVIRLGQDTTAVEHVTRTASKIVISSVGRSPRVVLRHYAFDLEKGQITHLSGVVTAPGSSTPLQTVEASMGADSVRLQARGASGPPQTFATPSKPGMLLVSGASPWACYETAIMRFVAGRKDSLSLPLCLLGAPAPYTLTLVKIGRDSVAFSNDHGDAYRARVDAGGHLVGVLPVAGTQKFSLERVAKLDLDGLAASFSAREKEGAGLGVLSPRDTVRVANAGGASLWVDYGRPGKRGREIFGNVVPYGAVWRTGANAATQFRTDKTLDFGGVVVPAGFYTLWTIPSRDGWKLVVNSETGQWGTEHEAEKDLYTIDMKLSSLPEPVERFTITIEPGAQGGVLNLDWDTTRASAAFTVKP
jgi:hypothetical protein